MRLRVLEILTYTIFEYLAFADINYISVDFIIYTPGLIGSDESLSLNSGIIRLLFTVFF